MIVLGLTGSIAMGKSRAAHAFRLRGVPVFDADAAVHALMAPAGAAVAAIDTAFPGCRSTDGGIDRKALGAAVLGNPPALARLERILHPLVRAAEHGFLRRACRESAAAVVLDIPLLLETGGERRVDRVAVVSANPVLQRQRALARPGMTSSRLAAIMAKQMPDAMKRRRAAYIIPSGADRGLLIATIDVILDELKRLAPYAWPRRPRP